jgi:hypothetical protein
MLRSILGEALDIAGADSGTDDRQPFKMRLLHFRRTFVEKLFTIHCRVERAVKQGRALGRDARHYYDLVCLLQQPETRAMIETPEYAEICSEYRDLTKRFYAGQTKFLPAGMDLSNSIALFPSPDLFRSLEAAYVSEAENLCYRQYPSFAEVLGAFEPIRPNLAVTV